MKLIIIFFCFFLFVNYSIAQNRNVKVSFEVNGKVSKYSEGQVKFIYKGDTLNIKIQDGNLSIPGTLIKRRATIIFYINKYNLKFTSIPVTLNSLSPNWSIGIYTKPFNRKKFWMIKSWKNVEVIYYLHNDDGRTFTVSNYKLWQIKRR